IIVTTTNFFTSNLGLDSDGGGGWCNPPNLHFVVPIEAFEKVTVWKAGNMHVQYRRSDSKFKI
ncbi:EXPA13, partial [Linum perenne]